MNGNVSSVVDWHDLINAVNVEILRLQCDNCDKLYLIACLFRIFFTYMQLMLL